MAHLITDSAGLAPLIFAGISGNPKSPKEISDFQGCTSVVREVSTTAATTTTTTTRKKINKEEC